MVWCLRLVHVHDIAVLLQVHRGVYEAAKLLYERYKPMVEEHLATSPFAKVSFTGHSLGGSLGSLLMLMFLHRGVIPISGISPTYTFGAPAIFCEASGPGGTCALAASPAPKALPAGGQHSAARAASPAAAPKVTLPHARTIQHTLDRILYPHHVPQVSVHGVAALVVSEAVSCRRLQRLQLRTGPAIQSWTGQRWRTGACWNAWGCQQERSGTS